MLKNKVMVFNKGYFAVALVLFIIEAVIAMFIHDTIVRPYIGDVLVVILLYCIIKSFFNFPVISTLIGVFIFAVAIEFSQLFHLTHQLGLENSKLATALLGNSFSWADLATYLCGIAIVILFERKFNLPNHYKATFETWNNLAKAYEEKFMDVDLYNDTYDKFCELLKSDAKIFEVGCGPGNITKYLLKKQPNFNITATDVAPTMVERAQINNPNATFEVMDARNIGAIKSKFDGVICGFCMPYLSKPDVEKLMSNCAALLDSHGIFYFSTIEGDYAESKFQKSSDGKHTMYIYNYDEKFLTDTLKKNQFEIVSCYRKSDPKAKLVSIHLTIIARKKS